MPFVEYDEAGAVCADCGRNFPSDEALAEHRRGTHEPAADRRKEASPAVAVCAVCQGRFRSVAALAAHNRESHTR